MVLSLNPNNPFELLSGLICVAVNNPREKQQGQTYQSVEMDFIHQTVEKLKRSAGEARSLSSWEK